MYIKITSSVNYKSTVTHRLLEPNRELMISLGSRISFRTRRLVRFDDSEPVESALPSVQRWGLTNTGPVHLNAEAKKMADTRIGGGFVGSGLSRNRLAVAIFAIVLLVGSSEAGRRLHEVENSGSSCKRLKAYSDETGRPRHGPPVKSFLVSDGMWIDCIRIEEQIAAHHPALKDHVIKMTTSTDSTLDAVYNDRPHPQRFANEHGGCPDGTIPVVRGDPNEMTQRKKFQSPVHGHKKTVAASTDSNASIDPAVATTGAHEYAVVELPTVLQSYGGISTTMSVNDPTIQDPSQEFSLSQVWVVAGSYSDSSINTAEVGWQVYPAQHPNDNDLAPHLFIYWTSDAYRTTGCYNLGCSGFVQTDNSWVLGGTFTNYTTLAANDNYELEFEVDVVYDGTNQQWTLTLSGTVVGYWPSSIYNKLASAADVVQWGGEMVPENTTTTHTTTAMGSGAFPDELYPQAAYHRAMKSYDLQGNAVDANTTTLGTIVTDANCYNAIIEGGGSPYAAWGSYFFFGGPGGGNAACVRQGP